MLTVMLLRAMVDLILTTRTIWCRLGKLIGVLIHQSTQSVVVPVIVIACRCLVLIMIVLQVIIVIAGADEG